MTKQEYGPWLKRMDKAKAAQKLFAPRSNPSRLLPTNSRLCGLRSKRFVASKRQVSCVRYASASWCGLLGEKMYLAGRSCMGRPSFSSSISDYKI